MAKDSLSHEKHTFGKTVWHVPASLGGALLSEPFRAFVTEVAISPVGRYSELLMRRGDSGRRNILLVFSSVSP